MRDKLSLISFILFGGKHMKIYYLLGKSCSGKSVLYTKLLADKKLKLTPIPLDLLDEVKRMVKNITLLQILKQKN